MGLCLSTGILARASSLARLLPAPSEPAPQAQLAAQSKALSRVRSHGVTLRSPVPTGRGRRSRATRPLLRCPPGFPAERRAMPDSRPAAPAIRLRRHATAAVGYDDRQGCGSAASERPLHDWPGSGLALSAWVIVVPSSGFGPGFFAQVSLCQRRLMRHVTHCNRCGLAGATPPCRSRRGVAKRTEGSPPWRANLAPQPCIRLDPRGVRTMKQPFASAARLRGGGHILPTALKPWPISCHHHLGSSSAAYRDCATGRRNCVFCSATTKPFRPPTAAQRPLAQRQS